MRVVTIYRSEPDWSALVELDDLSKLTLTFPEIPLESDVLALAAAVSAPPESVLEVEAEDGQILAKL